jgi:hypothetical protein
MSLTSFLSVLRETGRVRVDAVAEPLAADVAGLVETLESLDQDARLEMAFEPPAFSAEAAAWGAGVLYRGCQCLVFRDVGEAVVRAWLGSACPAARSASTAYCVDLAMKYLPDLLLLARGIAADDSLVECLRRLAKEWPLSSVGVEGLGEVDVRAFIDDRSLRQLYVDRILRRRDTSRLADARVRAAARETLGLYPELCSEIASAIVEESTHDSITL